ncbi:MAG TPA: hypothetical protein VFK73_08005 [Paludibacter sp.]|nr:hypothetical protein [Paludibacter sp.]
METNQSIEQVLEAMDNNIVYKTKSPLAIPILLIIVGICFFSVNSFFQWSSSSIYPSLFLILGSISFVVGILKFFFRKTYYVSAENHQKLKVREIYFDVNESDKLLRLMTNGNYADINSLKRSVSSGLKLHIMSTNDGRICFSQIIAYVQLEYANVNAPVRHNTAEVQILNTIR